MDRDRRLTGRVRGQIDRPEAQVGFEFTNGWKVRSYCGSQCMTELTPKNSWRRGSRNRKRKQTKCSTTPQSAAIIDPGMYICIKSSAFRVKRRPEQWMEEWQDTTFNQKNSISRLSCVK